MPIRLVLLCLLLVGACGSLREIDPPPQPQQVITTQPKPVAGACPAGAVDGGGFCLARAQQGDTVASLARRVGVAPSSLASYNGLAASDQLRSGDELVLPQ